MARILALALALIAPATAFVAPSARAAARAAPLQANSLPLNGWEPDSSKFAYGLPGTLDPVPDFDPAGLSADVSLDDIKLWREAEVTHGRIAMLAVVGFLTQENFHFLFVEPDKDIGPAIRHLDEVRAVNPAFFEILTFAIACCELYRALYGWVNPTAKGPGRNRLLSEDYYPGDIGFDPLNLKPDTAEDFAEMATKELQHGRLAMLAIAGFVAQELVDGQIIRADLFKLGE